MHGVIIGPATVSARTGPRLPGQRRERRRHSSAAVARGCDERGRFIGPHDIERGLKFFWLAPHRRGAAPIVRADPVFDHALRPGGQGGKGRPRAGSLDAAQLREMHRLKVNEKKTNAALAEHFGVKIGTIAYHFRGGQSVALRVALAVVPRP
jgi:hypothetical protein